MEKALETEMQKEKYSSFSPERRKAIRKLASEIAKDEDFIKAAEILENSSTLNIDESKFKSRLALVAALSVAIASSIMM